VFGYRFFIVSISYQDRVLRGTWHGNFSEHKLEGLFGFIEAFVSCPPSIRNPLLPYRDQESDVLLFPTGQFMGVYYSEELKYAEKIGYTIIPLRGYLYEKGYGMSLALFKPLLQISSVNFSLVLHKQAMAERTSLSSCFVFLSFMSL
jgi:DNA polymerase type B, organellar and viral